MFSCLCVLMNVLPVLSYRLQLAGKATSGSAKIQDHDSHLAVDGNPETFSASRSPRTFNELSWWRVDLGRTFTVQKVKVCNGDYFDGNVAYNLEMFDVHVQKEDGLNYLCRRHQSPPVAKRSCTELQCTVPSVGRYVYVVKIPGGYQDILVLSEVEVEVSEVGNTDNRYSSDPTFYGDPVRVTNCSQSRDYHQDHPARLAVDGNSETYSIAVPAQNGWPGWWQADLGQSYPVTGVTITSSKDYTNAQYLKNFAILVSQTDYTGDPHFSGAQSCFHQQTSQDVKSQQAQFFRCSSVLNGRYVTIKRLSNGAISLAEVQVYKHR